MKFRFSLLLALGVTLARLQAHDPLDCSSRMTVAEDEVQIVVTAGTDVAEGVLAAAGLPPEAVRRSIRERAESAALELPAAVGEIFFTVKSGDNVLKAAKVSVFSPGMEIIFTLSYPCPGAGPLQIRAAYFAAVKAAREGLFVALDAARTPLAAVVLSAANSSLEAPLAGPARLSTPAPGKQ